MTAGQAAAFDPALWVWGTDDRVPRVLHTMIRVSDLDRSLAFYRDALGMHPFGERFDVPARRVTAQFIGYGDYREGGALELVKAWDQRAAHTHGSGFGHVAIGVPDMAATVARLEARAVTFTLQPSALLPGSPQVAFIEDPDGYAIELIQTHRDPSQ